VDECIIAKSLIDGSMTCPVLGSGRVTGNTENSLGEWKKAGASSRLPSADRHLPPKANAAIDKWKDRALYNCRLKLTNYRPWIAIRGTAQLNQG
jgi:hypothetical protein